MLLLFRSEETRSISEYRTGESGELTRSEISSTELDQFSAGISRPRAAPCRVGSSFAKLEDGDDPGVRGRKGEEGKTEGDRGEEVARSSCVFAAGGARNYPK